METSISIFKDHEHAEVNGCEQPAPGEYGSWVTIKTVDGELTIFAGVDWLTNLVHRLDIEVTRQREIVGATHVHLAPDVLVAGESLPGLNADGTCTNDDCALCAAVRS